MRQSFSTKKLPSVCCMICEPMVILATSILRSGRPLPPPRHFANSFRNNNKVMQTLNLSQNTVLGNKRQECRAFDNPKAPINRHNICVANYRERSMNFGFVALLLIALMFAQHTSQECVVLLNAASDQKRPF